MDITIDLQSIWNFLTQPPYLLVWQVFSRGGWVIVLYIAIKVAWLWQKLVKQVEFIKNEPHVFLAVDVPRENEQSFKAAEQLFSALWGVYGPGTKWEQEWQGKVQLGFSFEIVSLEGVVQYIIRTPVKYRDVVESAIYAQYPEAEITEVKDYMDMVPQDAWHPESSFKLWGTQGVFNKHPAYPIKTYPYYEHLVSEQKIVDPLAPMLEAMSRLGKGELLAMQILMRPLPDKWATSADKIVKKMLGEKIPIKKNLGDKAIDSMLKGLSSAGSVVLGSEGATSVKKEEKRERNLLDQLTPGTKEALEGIERKTSKSCFEVKFRHLYVARKEFYKKPRGVAGFWGAMRSFAGGNINALRPGKLTTTEAEYLFAKQRLTKRRRGILNSFRTRNYFTGTGWLVMCTEELASLWHFPLISVKTPMLRWAGARKGEAPMGLMSVGEKTEFIEEVPLNLGDKTFEKRLATDHQVELLGAATQSEPTMPVMPNTEFVEATSPVMEETNSSTDEAKGEPPSNLPI